MFLEHDFKYFSTQVQLNSPDFPGGLPQLSPNFEPARSEGYIAKRNLDINKRYGLTRFEIDERFNNWTTMGNKVFQMFDPLLTDYDKEIILPTTCALSIQKPSHTDLDAAGTLGVNTDFLYRQDVLDAVGKFYTKYKKEVDPSLSLPRGKNLGWPHPISGKQRELADILLGLHAALAIGGKKQNMRLSELTRFLSDFHGEHYTIYGERTQHTAKTMPMICTEGTLFSNNFEPRVRGIYMSPKYMVAWNRAVVKNILATILNTPVHVQDRPTITKRISDAQAKGLQLIALDISKFDQSVGGQRGEQMLKFLTDTWGDANTHADFEHEFKSPLLLFTRKRAFFDRSVPILGSGMSFTSVFGCATNVVSTVQAMCEVFKQSPETVLANYGKTWDYLAWGDDTVLMLPKNIQFESVIRAYDSVKLKVDQEPVIKYLGNVYEKGQFAGSVEKGYSMGRALQQQFFPERPKDPPFSTVGYIARLDLMGQATGQAFHERMAGIWDNAKLGDYFRYADRHNRLKTLLPEVEKKSQKVSQIDDVLQILVHGITDTDMIDDFEFNEFSDFLGIVHMNLDDPAQALKEREISSRIVELIHAIQKGDFDAYNQFLTQVIVEFNLQWRPGDVLY